MVEEKKKKNKGTIVVIIILILIILGLGGYIVYDKVLKEEPVKVEEPKEEVVEQQEELVIGNTFKLDNITCEKDETSNCIKKVKVAYNNENHEVKLKLIETKVETEDRTKYSFEVYIDNESAGIIDAGITIPNEETTVFDDGFDATIYVVDSKYIAIQSPQVGWRVSYVLNFFNNKTKADKEVVVVVGGQMLCKDQDCTVAINALEDLEFDGSSFKYWGQDCDLMENVKYQVTFDGTNVNKTIVEKSGNRYGGGASC